MRRKDRNRKLKSNLRNEQNLSEHVAKLSLFRPFPVRCPARPPERLMETSFTHKIELIFLQSGSMDPSRPIGIRYGNASSPCLFYVDQALTSDVDFSVDFTLMNFALMLRSRLFRSSQDFEDVSSYQFTLLKVDKISVWGPTQVSSYRTRPFIQDYLVSWPLRLTLYNFAGTRSFLDRCPPTCPKNFFLGMCSAQDVGNRSRRARVSIRNPNAQYSLIMSATPEDPSYLNDPILANVTFGFPYFKDRPNTGGDPHSDNILGIMHVTATGIFCRDSIEFAHFNGSNAISNS